MAAEVQSCPVCLNESFSTAGDLILAFVGFLQRPLTCPLCSALAPDASTLSQHLLLHLPPRQSEVVQVSTQQQTQYDCKQCQSFHTPDLSALRLHVEAAHPERKFLCVQCLKLFKAQASLTLHLRMAHPSHVTDGKEKCHQCQHCSKSFASIGRKQAHERVHQLEATRHTTKTECKSPEMMVRSEPSSPSKPLFVCLICDKSFKKDQYLQQHIRTHEAKKWECSICKKLFTTKEYLRKHARLHTGETPYNCDQCGKTFTFQQSFHKHLLYHSDERPYACDQCNRRFKELSTLHNHQRIHTGEKPYVCDVCGKAFRQRVSYVVHRRIHTGALPYVCSHCGKSFRYKVSQRTHKCEVTRSEEDGPDNINKSVVRQRPPWLERLMTAAQQQFLSKQTDVHPSVETVTPLNNDSIVEALSGMESPVAQQEQVPAVSQQSTNNNPPLATSSSELLFDPQSCYYEENDSIPIIDLSQLTLSLDSELIFPS